MYCLLLLALVRATVGEERGGRLAWALPPLFFLLMWSFQIWLSSPTPDCVLPVLLGFAFLRYARKWERGHGRRFDADTVLVGLVILLAVTIKLSALPAVLLPLHSLWASRRATPGPYWILTAGLLLFTLLPWLLRGVLLSGYLIYPVAALDWLAVEWKIPLAAVRMEQYMITNVGRWARQPACVPPHQALAEWVPRWWTAQSDFIRGVGLLAAASVVPALGRWRRRSCAATGWAVGWLTAWLGGIFWFFTAPDYRFGVGFLLMAGLWPWLTLVLVSERLKGLKWLPLLLTLAWGLESLRDPFYQLRTRPQAVVQRLLWPAPPPPVPTLTLTTGKSLPVRVPQTGMQCWNAPLPCTNCAEVQVEKRGLTLKQGFRAGRAQSGRVCCLEVAP